MTDLTAFLLARIAEDEAVARSVRQAVSDLLKRFSFPRGGYAGDYYGDFADRILKLNPGDPARTLATCAAYKAIVEEHHKVRDQIELENLKRGPTWGCVCYGGWPCRTIRALASIWGDHPAYEAGWRLS